MRKYPQRPLYNPPNEKLYIIKSDTVDSKSITTIVDYKVFDFQSNELNLSLCDKCKIAVLTPITNFEGINITYAKSFSDSKIDIFNRADSFFNDLCSPYIDDNGNDITLSDRVKDIYKEVSFCQKGYVYNGINYA